MRAWLEISLENLKYNVKKLKEKNNKEIIPVLKANAYGLGSIEIARCLSEEGINFFAVANIEEAIEILKQLPSVKILVLGLLCEDEFKLAEKYNISITISSLFELKYIVSKKLKLNIHLKLETGMTRLGLDEEEFIEAVNFCDENNIFIEGVFSHLSDADGITKESKEFTKKQLEKFRRVIEKVSKKRNNNFNYIHIQNSAGSINYQDFDFANYIRVGLALYGFMANKTVSYLKPVFELKAKIIFKKKVSEDVFVSYGRTSTLDKGDTYAVLSLGYADGLKRYLRNSHVLINDNKIPIVGAICMDMFMIKLPKDNVNMYKLGQEVTVLNYKNIDESNYEDFSLWEIMTGIGNRVKRIYLGEKNEKNHS